MKKEEVIKKFKQWFYSNYDANIELDKMANDYLKRFCSGFTPDKIKKMTKKQYAAGSGNKDSFCYWVERRLNQNGEMAIRGCGHYGIYWSKDCKKYVNHTNKSGVNSAFKEIKESILGIINAATNNKSIEIDNFPFVYRFALKIYYLYSSNGSLPIYSKDHIDLLLDILEITNYCKTTGVLDKNLILFSYYKSIETEEMTPLLFVRFLYDNDYGFGFYLKPHQTINVFKGHYIGKEFVDLLKNRKKNKFGNYQDYNESPKQTKLIGDKGQERARLYFELNKERLGIKNIEYPGYEGEGKNDAAGCDIIYITKDNIKHYCEIKASNNKAINFYMSSNEWDTMRSNHRVYDVMFYPDVLNQDKFIIFTYKDLVGKEHPSKYRFKLKQRT